MPQRILYSNIGMLRGYSFCSAPSAWCCNDNGISTKGTTLTCLTVPTVWRISTVVLTFSLQRGRKKKKKKTVGKESSTEARLRPSLSAALHNMLEIIAHLSGTDDLDYVILTYYKLVQFQPREQTWMKFV